MTRQIALGAVISFAVTVLVLSVWQPSTPLVPQPQAIVPPVALPPPTVHELHPAALRATLIDTSALALPARRLDPVTTDAGAP